MEKEDAKILIDIARKSIEEELFGIKFNIPEEVKKKYSENKGAFVTLLMLPKEELRGCIGFPLPVHPLWKAIYLAAKEAAFADPRFPPLTPDEYKNIIVEISVLTPPRKVEIRNEEEAIRKIIIGKHGILVRRGLFSGLLLPQVAIEWNWDPVTFLCQTCIKAGLPPAAWKWEGTEIFLFEGEVWKEKVENGKREIVRVLPSED